jgi:hypothetical protein
MRVLTDHKQAFQSSLMEIVPMLHHPFDGRDVLTHNQKLQQSERRWQDMQCWERRDYRGRKHPRVTSQKWRKQEPEVEFHSQWPQRTNCTQEGCEYVKIGCREIVPQHTRRFSDNWKSNSDSSMLRRYVFLHEIAPTGFPCSNMMHVKPLTWDKEEIWTRPHECTSSLFPHAPLRPHLCTCLHEGVNEINLFSLVHAFILCYIIGMHTDLKP